MKRSARTRPFGQAKRGQALVEFALVFPIFALILFGIIVVGLGLFYQEQLTNAAREAARYASIHSATAQNPTVSHLDPWQNVPPSYARSDAPENGWPLMTAAGRDATWGLDRSKIYVAACWSGYVDPDWTTSGATNWWDYPPPGTYDISGSSVNVASVTAACSIGGVADPQNNVSQIACAAGLSTADTASDQSDRTGEIVANSVTVYACYQWTPPMAGFLMIPNVVTMRAVITEPIERQQ